MFGKKYSLKDKKGKKKGVWGLKALRPPKPQIGPNSQHKKINYFFGRGGKRNGEPTKIFFFPFRRKRQKIKRPNLYFWGPRI